jgi:hypothetical protein
MNYKGEDNMNNKIVVELAVKVGYVFAIVDSDSVRGISLTKTDTIVVVNNKQYILYAGTTFEDSQKIDNLFDSGKYVERNIDDYIINNFKTFDVTVTRLGCIQVQAKTIEEARKLANETSTENVAWDEDWAVTDINEE